MKYERQLQRVYYSEEALVMVLRRFGFFCKWITPAKAFCACGGSWLGLLSFVDADFTWQLDDTVLVKQCYPTMILDKPDSLFRLRLCSCNGGGCSGYRLFPIDEPQRQIINLRQSGKPLLCSFQKARLLFYAKQAEIRKPS